MDGYVYIFACMEIGRVKIGHSKDPARRYRELKTSTPGKLAVVAIIPGDQSLESSFHRMFASDHAHGEWFACSRSQVHAMADIFRGIHDQVWTQFVASLDTELFIVLDSQAAREKEEAQNKLLEDFSDVLFGGM